MSGPQALAHALTEISKAMARSDYRRAFEHANTALAKGMVHAKLHSTRAVWFSQQQRDDLALEEFDRALAMTPDDPLLLGAMGLCLTRLQQFGRAALMFERAVKIEPGNAANHYRRGRALASAGRTDEAEAALRQAQALAPDNAEIVSSLASLAVGKGDFEGARRYAEKAMALAPGDATAISSLASIEIAGHDYKAAEARLRPLLQRADLQPQGRAVVQGLLGDALDGQERTAEAFTAYLAEKAELQRQAQPVFAGRRRVVEITEDLMTYFSNAPTEWSLTTADDEPVPGAAETHVFLVGFIRSGTTLLEQVLGSHPEVSTLDERDCLAEPAERYLVNYEGLQKFGALAGDGLARERAAYWSRVAKLGVDTSKPVFVDKLPLNTIKLPLIAKLFPRAKIVFALRDPRDVVLSCLRRHFAVNAAMYETLSPESAARFYNAVMRLGDLSHEMLPLPFVHHRYEDLVSDFDAAVGRICDYIGIMPVEEMRRFTQTAPVQPILSPSAGQVRRELHAESVGQWRRYADQLEAVLLTLQPWVDRFSYPAA